MYKYLAHINKFYWVVNSHPKSKKNVNGRSVILSKIPPICFFLEILAGTECVKSKLFIVLKILIINKKKRHSERKTVNQQISFTTHITQIT